MPEILVLGLISSFLLLAISTTLKAAGLSHSLKLSNEEVTSLRKQIKVLEKKKKNFTLEAGKGDIVNKEESIDFHINPKECINVKLNLESKNILDVLFNSNEYVNKKQLVNDINIEYGVIGYHIDLLIDYGFIKVVNPFYSATHGYLITDLGRKYIVEKLRNKNAEN